MSILYILNGTLVFNLHPAPITKVFPGGVVNENISSLVMQYSLQPGKFGYRGRPPTAITIFLAVSLSSVPFFFLAITVWGSSNTPWPLTYLICLYVHLFLITKCFKNCFI